MYSAKLSFGFVSLVLAASCASADGERVADGAATSAFTTYQALEAIPLNVVWQVGVNGARTDRMSTIDPAERDGFPLDGQAWYLAAQPIAGTKPVYRLFNGWVNGFMDHMDSTVAGEGGYSTESTLGYAFASASAQPGLALLLRTYNPNGDHGTRATLEPQASGYHDESLGVYGFSRIASNFAATSEDTSSLVASGGGITAEVSLVAGAAVWRWTYGGYQYLNHFDYGREMQAAMFFPDPNPLNPTEAGDANSYPALPFWRRHGSPVISASVSGASISTRTVPLEWEPYNAGGGPDHPALWHNLVLGKEVVLGYNNRPGVAKYTTVVNAPSAVDAKMIEAPVVFVRSELSSLHTYDATHGQLSTRSLAACSAQSASASLYYYQDAGGPIAATPDGAHALGIYVRGGTNPNASIVSTRCGGTAGETGTDTVALQALHVGRIPAGESRYDAYVVTGTLTEVEQSMTWLASGAPIQPPPPPANCGALASGACIYVGQTIPSCANGYAMTLDGSDRLVVTQNGAQLWSDGATGSAGAACMQSDGNFVVYDGGGRALWNSVTPGFPGAHLAVQDDGNVVVYAANNGTVNPNGMANGGQALWSWKTGRLY